MKQPTLKSAGFVLLGVVVGCAIGRPPWWRGGAGTDGGQFAAVVVPGGPGSGLAHSGSLSGTGKAGGKRSQKHLEVLAASFRSKCAEGDEAAAVMAMTLEAGALPKEEIGLMITLLIKDENAWEAVELLAVRWGMLDPEAALAFALGSPALKNSRQTMASIVQELAKSDLPAANAALRDLDAGGKRDADLAIVRLLERTDIHAALAHARGMKDDELEGYILTTLAGKDPMAAAAELTPGRMWHLETVQVIADALLRSDRATFQTWMESLKDPAQQVMAFEAALSPQFQPDAKSAALEAAAWLTVRPEVFNKARSLSARLARRWMKADGPPAEVAAWAAALPEGRARDSAVEQVARSWAVEDAAASSAWIATLPPGEARDSAVLGLVLTIGHESPVEVFEWARRVETPAMRSEVLMNAVERWAAKDPDGFAAAVEMLPDSDRVRLQDVAGPAEREREKTEEQ